MAPRARSYLTDSDDEFTTAEVRELAYEDDNMPIGHQRPLTSASRVTLANRATHRAVAAAAPLAQRAGGGATD